MLKEIKNSKWQGSPHLHTTSQRHHNPWTTKGWLASDQQFHGRCKIQCQFYL